MLTLKRVTPSMVEIYKAVRLRALLDSPSAFGSTYAREAAFSDAVWAERAETMQDGRSVIYIAFADEEPCGIMRCNLDDAIAGRAYLTSVWVSPSSRRTGIGCALLQAIEAWAVDAGARELRLMVTSSNEAAISFYERLGYGMTGVTEPYPHDAALVECEMLKNL